MEDKNKLSRKTILIVIFSLIAVIITGTFAWLNWRSQNTAMVLRVGNIRGLQVTLTPYQINGTLSPVSDYTDGLVINVTANNQKSTADDFKLFYKINTIDTELIDTGFKYTITKCEANCDTVSNYQVLNDASGDFSSASANSNLTIYSETVPASTTYKYKVYLWIDSSSGNQSNMQNKTFAGELRASISNTIYNMMKEKATIDNTRSTYVTNNSGINWDAISSDTNGKGIYLRAGTENDTYPIYYYRGEVTDNNVLFANFCWKIVRTTSTGGTKLIYNGTLQETFSTTTLPDSSFTVTNDASYPFTYDSTNMTWTSTMHTDSASAEIVFAPNIAGDYILNYTVSSEANYDKAYFYKNGTELKVDSGSQTGTVVLNGLTSSDTIKVKYQKDSSGSNGNDNVIFSIGSKGAATGTTCNNTGIDSQLAATSKFNNNSDSPADVGYMYGTRYVRISKAMTSLTDTYMYATGYDETNHRLVATNAMNFAGTDWATYYNQLSNNHYTCFNTTGECNQVYYIYYTDNSTAYYVTIPNGKTISGMLDEMLTNSTNTNDSTIKGAIDNWYSTNMTSYESKLEDTPYCNDRGVYQLNGWSPTGSTTDYMYFGSYGRTTQSPYTPSLTCNTNDAFTKSSSIGNGKLTYPVGLLTADEIRLAGGRRGTTNSTYYLYTGVEWWSASPNYFNDINAYEFYVNPSGSLRNYSVLSARGVRPAVSLKPGAKFVSGDGSPADPYVVDMTSSSSTQTFASWDFEGNDIAEAAPGWTFVDADGDGNNWLLNSSSQMAAQSGNNSLISYSCINGSGALNASNYAITPAISLTNYENVHVDFYMASQDRTYLDSFEVLYGSTNNPAQMTTAISLQKAPNTWQQYTIDLSGYNGDTVYIAFHHQDNDNFVIKLDNIQVHGDYVGS